MPRRPSSLELALVRLGSVLVDSAPSCIIIALLDDFLGFLLSHVDLVHSLELLLSVERALHPFEAVDFDVFNAPVLFESLLGGSTGGLPCEGPGCLLWT